MKKTHFRIIELKTHQVLLSKHLIDEEYEESEKKYAVKIVFFEGDTKLEYTSIHYDEKSMDDQFNNFTEQQAQEMVDNNVHRLVENFFNNNK